MIKTTLTTSLLVSLLCGPAVAESISSYRIDFTIGTGSTAEHYAVLVSDRSCGETGARTRDAREHLFKVCVDPTDDNRVRLDIERRVRSKRDDAHTNAVVVTRSGASFDLLDTKVTVNKLP
jgi:hypothetical protein